MCQLVERNFNFLALPYTQQLKFAFAEIKRCKQNMNVYQVQKLKEAQNKALKVMVRKSNTKAYVPYKVGLKKLLKGLDTNTISLENLEKLVWKTGEYTNG